MANATAEHGMRPLDWCNALGFVVYAGSAAITPIALMVLAREMQFTFTSGGALEVARSALIVVALLASGFVAGRCGKAPSLAVSSLLLSLGLLLYCFAPSYGVVIIALVIAGCGGGIIEGLINPLVQDQHPHDSGRYLNIVNGFWSVGVLLTMLVVGEWLTWEGSWRLPLAVLAGAAALAAACYALFAYQERQREVCSLRQTAQEVRHILRSPMFWFFWLMMVLAGAAEGGLTFWTASFIQVEHDGSARLAGLATACFGLGMMVGRFAIGLIVRQSLLWHTMVGSAAAAVLCTLALPFLPWIPILLLTLFVSGLGIACLWPSLQSYAAERLPLESTNLFILLSCGGIPGYAGASWALGHLAQHYGFTLALGAIPLAMGMLLALLLLLPLLLGKPASLAPDHPGCER
ncbi:MAG: MFS transporter [Planctomycetota bacterium]|nr:MAG: MFS transporter [Planctomycetota bacterium]